MDPERTHQILDVALEMAAFTKRRGLTLTEAVLASQMAADVLKSRLVRGRLLEKQEATVGHDSNCAAIGSASATPAPATD